MPLKEVLLLSIDALSLMTKPNGQGSAAGTQHRHAQAAERGQHAQRTQKLSRVPVRLQPVVRVLYRLRHLNSTTGAVTQSQSF